MNLAYQRLGRAVLCAATLLVSATAQATDPEPWTDDDGRDQPRREEFGEYGARFDGEYRANWLYINPINLAGERNRKASWIEHRLRLNTTIDFQDKVRFVTSVDALNGTLWGDNGTFGGDPATNSGIRVSASNPNNTRPVIAYTGSGDQLSPDSYGYTLREAPALTIRRAYGEVVTPVGILRIGRQPTLEGTALLVADGDGRPNRFGYSNLGDSSDRLLFATKPLEGLKPKHLRDKSPDRGLIVATFYDRTTTADPRLFGDDLHGAGGALIFRKPEPAKKRSLTIAAAAAHRWETIFDTDINFATVRAWGRWGKLQAGAEGVYINGRTREISEALSLINSDPVVRQKVHQGGARAVVRWDEPKWTAYFEFDFATGDADPNPGSTLSNITWAEDTNVGLLMFERILAFQSGRSSAAGVELLKRIGAETFPAGRVDTEGSFTSALAIFPQFDLKPKENLLLRGGVLAAWAPAGLVDPLTTLTRRDGKNIDDDVVNFAGGKPGDFIGVELDGRFQWRYLDHFIFDLEGAVFFPGNAMQDENGDAVRSVLIQGRTTFAF